MEKLIETLDNLPMIAKILLCLPVVDIVWSIYRVCRSFKESNVLAIILSIVLLIGGPTFWWIVDLICMIVFKKIVWLC